MNHAANSRPSGPSRSGTGRYETRRPESGRFEPRGTGPSGPRARRIKTRWGQARRIGTGWSENGAVPGQADHSRLVIAAHAQVLAVPVNSGQSPNLARANRTRMPNPSRAIARRARHFVRRVRAVIEVARQPLTTSRSGVNPVKTKGAGKMPMASGLAVREPEESRVLTGHAAKARELTDRNSTDQGTTERNQVGPGRGVSAHRPASIGQVPTDLGRRAETMSSSVLLLPAVAHSVPVVHGPAASRSGLAVRVTHALHSGLDPDQHQGRGQHLARVRGRLTALARGRVEHLGRLDRGLLPEARRAEAAAVRGHHRAVSANRAKRKLGSRTEAAHGAVGAPAARDALNPSRLRATQRLGSVARMNSAR